MAINKQTAALKEAITAPLLKAKGLLVKDIREHDELLDEPEYVGEHNCPASYKQWPPVAQHAHMPWQHCMHLLCSMVLHAPATWGAHTTTAAAVGLQICTSLCHLSQQHYVADSTLTLCSICSGHHPMIYLGGTDAAAVRATSSSLSISTAGIRHGAAATTLAEPAATQQGPVSQQTTRLRQEARYDEEDRALL